jgi:hypothetical protein
MGYVLLIFLGFYYVVLLCAITFLVPCCGIHFGFRMKTMFGSSLPPVVCGMAYALFTLFVFACA